MSPRISLDDVGDEKNHIRIRNSRIREILNEQPVTKMVDRRELDGTGHLIMDGNRQPWKVWGKKLRGHEEKENQG